MTNTHYNGICLWVWSVYFFFSYLRGITLYCSDPSLWFFLTLIKLVSSCDPLGSPDNNQGTTNTLSVAINHCSIEPSLRKPTTKNSIQQKHVPSNQIAWALEGDGFLYNILATRHAWDDGIIFESVLGILRGLLYKDEFSSFYSDTLKFNTEFYLRDWFTDCQEMHSIDS